MLSFCLGKDIINSHEHARVLDLHDLIFTRVANLIYNMFITMNIVDVFG